MTMALRHRQHLIFKHLQLIFDGTDGKEKISAITTYILGVGERSEEQFLEQIRDTSFTVKPEVMSTLEQILERGRKEGREEGIYKKSIFSLLKMAVRFPDLPTAELSDLTDLELNTVNHFLEVAAHGEKELLLKHIQEELLADIPLTAEEQKKLTELTEELAEEKK